MKKNAALLALMLLGILALAGSSNAYADEDAPCVIDGDTCVMGGAPCCSALSKCKGFFPATTCQADFDKNQ